MASNTLVVRRLTVPAEVKQFICEKRVFQGLRPGALDHESFFAADENGFYVGELGPQIVSCVSIVKHTEDYAFAGNYLVQEPFRGKGYGKQTWNMALMMATVSKDCNGGVNSVVEREHMCEKGGFKRVWIIDRLDFVASEAAAVFTGITLPPGTKIVPAAKVEFQDIVQYDQSVYGFPRQRFLEKWIDAPNSHCYVSTSKEERVVGYVVVRTTLRQEEGWRIGPLFANDSTIARSLYKAVFGRVANEDNRAIVCADVPLEGDVVNKSAFEIVQELSFTPVMRCIRMYTKGIPKNMQVSKIFGHTAVEIY